MVTKQIKFFNLKKIMNSGQIFRMYEPEDGRFAVYSGNRRLELVQKGENTEFFCSPNEFEEYWEDYFDLKRDYGGIVQKAGDYAGTHSIGGAEFLKKACIYGADIRILKQDIWEMMISFIISQQKQIPSIRKCIEALCERFGEKHIVTCNTGKVESGEEVWYGFPDAKSIAAAGPDGLKGLSLGYRERYIYETAVKYLKDGIPDEKLKGMERAEVKKYLLTFTGIGEKVADCICLFGVGLADSFPIDVHIKDILYREFVGDDKKKEVETLLRKKSGTAELSRKKVLECLSYQDYMKIINENFSVFDGVRGIVQQWIFAYELYSLRA